MDHDSHTMQPQTTRASVGRAIGTLSVQVAEAVAADINSQLESYAGVPQEAIIESVQRNMARGIAVLIDGAVPTSVPEQAEAGDTTRERLEQGARWEDIVRAYRMSLTAVHAEFLEEATKSALNPAATLEGSSLLWELSDWFINGSAEAFTTWSNEVAGSRAAAEAEFVRGLLNNDWRNPQFSAMVRRFGFTAHDSYRVFIAPEQSSADVAASAGAATTPHLNSRQILIGAVLRHRYIGIIRDDVALQLPDAAVAVGTATTLDHLKESAYIAESIWSVILSKSPGTYDLSEIGWLVAVPQHPELSRMYIDRYIAPLEPETAAGRALMTSLSVLMKHDGNIRLAADELQLHENSLRYRLERFTEKTGVKLTSLQHKIGLVWGIQAYEQEFAPPTFGEFYK